jgi:hypothetical protein
MRAETARENRRAFPAGGDGDADAFGAEALPGGLAGINEARGGATPAPRGPILGLIALARHWMRRRVERD